VGDLDLDTALEGAAGRYRATLREDWNIWGPCGGYVAAVVLRAAGRHSSFARPATLTCHFLGVAEFAPVDVRTETLRGGRRSESIRVSMTQGERPICEALVWTVADTDGLAFDWTEAPDVPEPGDLLPIEELLPDEEPWFPFWNNLESRPVSWLGPDQWEAQRPIPPVLENWYRFRPTAAFEDPFLEASRVTVLADIMGWPTAHRAVPVEQDNQWIAPNLDVGLTFHQDPRGSEFLLLDADAPLATQGMIGARGRVWSEDGRLLATAVQQMLSRPMPPQYRR
jgi:acyl-CoA thioesterase